MNAAELCSVAQFGSSTWSSVLLQVCYCDQTDARALVAALASAPGFADGDGVQRTVLGMPPHVEYSSNSSCCSQLRRSIWPSVLLQVCFCDQTDARALVAALASAPGFADSDGVQRTVVGMPPHVAYSDARAQGAELLCFKPGFRQKANVTANTDISKILSVIAGSRWAAQVCVCVPALCQTWLHLFQHTGVHVFLSVLIFCAGDAVNAEGVIADSCCRWAAHAHVCDPAFL